MPKKIKQIPDKFETYEEAADFWDTHDSTDYLDILEEVEIKVDIQRKHYFIELDMNTAKLLQECARKKGVAVNYLANELLHKQLVDAE